jgi:hypothetical protein
MWKNFSFPYMTNIEIYKKFSTCGVISDFSAQQMWRNMKGLAAIATLKPTFTFLGRYFAIFNTFTWQNPYQEK